MRNALLLLAVFAALGSLCGPALAVVGDASPADIAVQRYAILVYSVKGRCSGVVLAQDLVLTAAHCVERDKDADAYLVGGAVGVYRFANGKVAVIARHPEFRKTTQFNADLAIIKLAEPLPGHFTPAFLQGRSIRVGDRVIVGGYGSSGQAEAQVALRSAALVVSRMGEGRAFLADANREEGARLGPCHGDSGGPVFTYGGLFALVGIMQGGDCKGVGSIVMISHYYGWILDTAEKLGSPLK